MASKFQKGVVIATVFDVIIAIGIIVLVGVKISEEVPNGRKSSPITATTPLNFRTTNLPLSPSDKPNVTTQSTALFTRAASTMVPNGRKSSPITATTPLNFPTTNLPLSLSDKPKVSTQSTALFTRAPSTENSLTKTDAFLSSTKTSISSDDENAEYSDDTLETLQSEVFDHSKITGYYNVILAILTSRIFASLLIFIGHKMDIPEFLKSHLDMSIPLTILNFAVYIFIVAEGSPHKEFTALMAVYIVIRKIVLVMEFLHVNHQSAEPTVQKFSVRYAGSTIESVDSTGNQPI
ncbi:unnamed protein product [Allacma fusca]|uniref:Uncharacterized protein n=1 Tax=Allacma fusca TaxID=39272 RepID=A0A8J2JUD6_9HEXA|nr:unnamed protein product [Allacma fusca]